MCVCMCERVRERMCVRERGVCVCESVCVRERERDFVCVHVRLCE